MDSANMQRILASAAAELRTHERELAELDAETGDGDHGIAIARISQVILDESRKAPRERMQDYFDDLCIALLKLDGGSAGNLWGVMMEGIGEAWSDAEDLKGRTCRMLCGAMRGIGEISRAKVGEKTLLDTLNAARIAAEDASAEDAEAYLRAVAAAAAAGAEATGGMIARHGRAKNLHEKSKGHRDPGAVSLAMMIQALCLAEIEERAYAEAD